MFVVLAKALIIKEDKILLIKRNDKSLFGGGIWDIPGGKVEFGESPEESLIREIHEEISLNIKLLNVIDVNSAIDKNAPIQYITIVYISNYVNGTIQLNDEHSEYAWVDIRNNEDYKKLYYVEDAIVNYLKK